MAGRKRRRSAFDNDTDRATVLPKIVIPPSTSKRKDTIITSRSNHVPGKRIAGSSPPRKKPKLKSAAGRLSTAEPATSTRPSTVRNRVTRASSVSMPDTPFWYFTSSGIPARLARGSQSDIFSKSQDIYPHLATKEAMDSAEPLQREHRDTGKSNPLRPPLRKKRGRPSRTIQSDDEDSKAMLMQQWATLRMSQGTLLSTATVGRVLDTIHVPSDRSTHEPPLNGRSEKEIPSGEVVELDKPPDLFSARDHMELSCLWPSVSPVVEPVADVNIAHETIPNSATGITPNTPCGGSPLLDDLRYPTSSPETGQSGIAAQQANVGIETIAQASPHPATNVSVELANQLSQPLATSSEAMSPRPLITCIMSELDIPSESIEPEDSQSRISPSAVDTQPLVSRKAEVEDALLDFNMLDLFEILSPWVPASPTAPSVYVPPVVHHLIAGMKHQLEAEGRARRRAEELYLEEMQRRMRMEEVIGKLRKEKIQSVERKASPTRVYMSNASAKVAGDVGQTLTYTTR